MIVLSQCVPRITNNLIGLAWGLHKPTARSFKMMLMSQCIQQHNRPSRKTVIARLDAKECTFIMVLLDNA